MEYVRILFARTKHNNENQDSNANANVIVESGFGYQEIYSKSGAKTCKGCLMGSIVNLELSRKASGV